MQKELRVVFLGDAQVGKSKVSDRLTSDVYTEKYTETIGPRFKVVRDPNSSYKIQIWDTAGQLRFRILRSMYYQNVDVFCVMWDPLASNPLDDLRELVEEHRNGYSNIPIIFVRCKIDLPVDEKVLADQIKAITSLMGGKATILATSAKTDEGIQELKSKILEYDPKPNPKPHYQRGSISTHAQKPKKKCGSCCGLFSRRKKSPDTHNLLEERNSTSQPEPPSPV